MKSKKVLALMMGAIVASSGMSQMAVQVYAHDGESISSLEYIKNGSDAERLRKLTNFTSRRVNRLLRRGNLEVENLSNLYVSENNLVFEPTSDTEVRLVCLDEESEFNGDIVVPEEVFIEDKPYSVTSIGNAAFDGCSKLQLETLPESLKIIGENAFTHCFRLKLRELPTNLCKIGTRAFAFCVELNLRALPENLREIGNGAFTHCVDLELEKLPENLEVIGESTFTNCNILNLRALPDNLREIGNYAFANCVRLQLGELPEGLEIIGENTFESCGKLNLRALPTNLREIGNGAFIYCRSLELRELPKNLCKIGNDAFASTSIKTITIPASVTELGNSAFDTYSIERIDLSQESILNNYDIERAYGEQLRIIGQRIFTPVELSDEVAEKKCPICRENFKEENGEVGGLPCGHYIHLDCFDGVRFDFRQGNRTFKCPVCEKEYNI